MKNFSLYESLLVSKLILDTDPSSPLFCLQKAEVYKFLTYSLDYNWVWSRGCRSRREKFGRERGVIFPSCSLVFQMEVLPSSAVNLGSWLHFTAPLASLSLFHLGLQQSCDTCWFCLVKLFIILTCLYISTDSGEVLFQKHFNNLQRLNNYATTWIPWFKFLSTHSYIYQDFHKRPTHYL